MVKKIIALLIIVSLLSPITTQASGSGFAKFVIGTYKAHKRNEAKAIREREKADKKAQKETRQYEEQTKKLNDKYLRIRDKENRGQKLTKEESRFYEICKNRIEANKERKRLAEQQQNVKEEIPSWKKVLGGWLYDLQQQPEWQEEFYTNGIEFRPEVFSGDYIETKIIEAPDTAPYTMPMIETTPIRVTLPSPAPLPVLP